MSSAVHVVGIKGVVFSLEGGKEKGDGYKSDLPTSGNSQVCRARTKAGSKPHGREGASRHGTDPSERDRAGRRKLRSLSVFPPAFTKKKGWLVTTEQFAEKKQCDYALLQN